MTSQNVAFWDINVAFWDIFQFIVTRIFHLFISNELEFLLRFFFFFFFFFVVDKMIRFNSSIRILQLH